MAHAPMLPPLVLAWHTFTAVFIACQLPVLKTCRQEDHIYLFTARSGHGASLPDHICCPRLPSAATPPSPRLLLSDEAACDSCTLCTTMISKTLSSRQCHSGMPRCLQQKGSGTTNARCAWRTLAWNGLIAWHACACASQFACSHVRCWANARAIAGLFRERLVVDLSLWRCHGQTPCQWLSPTMMRALQTWSVRTPRVILGTATARSQTRQRLYQMLLVIATVSTLPRFVLLLAATLLPPLAAADAR
jgi:hypothetical protein